MAACRVLLADDTDEIRLLLRMALEINGGFEVVAEASDGHQALELTADHRPDAVILDVAMPPMDGLEVIPAIRKVVPDTRILVVSGFNSQHMERAALAAGADAYLEKGVAPEEIVRVLERLCIDHGMGTPVDDSVAKLAHDLLTPVAVIRGFAEAIAHRAREISNDEIADWADNIVRGSESLIDLVRRFRDSNTD